MTIALNTRPGELRDDLITRYDRLAVRLARQFRTHRELRDDLEQVARVGLIHAADRFDPSRERPFVAFARATIVGELKRHLRDCTWQMRMPRSLHDSYLMVVHALDDLTQELGRSPLISEVAARTGLSEDLVLEAMDVRYPVSLDRPANGNQYQEPTEDDARIEQLQDDSLLASLLAPLTDQQRRVVRLYFVDGLSQHQIGDKLGVSQMCISRLLTKSIRQMRRHAERQARHE